MLCLTVKRKRLLVGRCQRVEQHVKTGLFLKVSREDTAGRAPCLSSHIFNSKANILVCLFKMTQCFQLLTLAGLLHDAVCYHKQANTTRPRVWGPIVKHAGTHYKQMLAQEWLVALLLAADTVASTWTLLIQTRRQYAKPSLPLVGNRGELIQAAGLKNGLSK